jgi:hypothetical protein
METENNTKPIEPTVGQIYLESDFKDPFKVAARARIIAVAKDRDGETWVQYELTELPSSKSNRFSNLFTLFAARYVLEASK